MFIAVGEEKLEKEKLIKYAVKNTEFYERKFINYSEENLDWKKLPITTKDEVAHAGISIVSREYYGKLVAGGEVVSDFTSGSTGECLEIFTVIPEQNLSMLSLWLYRKKYYDIDTKSRLCYFYTYRDQENEQTEERRNNSYGFLKDSLNIEKNIETIFNKMYEFQPEWLLLQPSIAMVLARYIFETGENRITSVRYIELTGEMFTESQRKFIMAAFNAIVASQYGCNEVGTIAYECPNGNMHIMTENVHVDIECREKTKYDYGDVVVTAKNRLVMPIIKYKTGDIGRVKQCQCMCGNKNDIIELQEARDNDLIILKNGTTISANIFVNIFKKIEWSIDGRIYQYRIKQKDYDMFHIKIATNENEENIKNLFFKYIKKSLIGKNKFKFTFFDYILPEEKSGKLRFFTSEAIKMHDT